MIENIKTFGRIILAAFTVGVLAWVTIAIPEIDIEKLITIAAPATLYIGLKWTGTK